MTFGGFILGLVLFGFGFLLVWRTNWFIENFGDLGMIIGWQNASWLSWKLLGMFLMLMGFLIAFGLLQAFFAVTIGGLFGFGNFSP